jgi:Uma2 family endonuclease
MATGGKVTYDDLVRVPEHLVGEIAGGELYATPRPGSRHGPGGWWIRFEPELRLGDDVLVPDLAGWRRQRLPDFPDTASFTLAPDWACEVVSPSTERLDRSRKLPIYAREGVGHAWLVNPAARTLEVLRRDASHWLLLAVHGGDEVVRVEPFAAVALDLLVLWGESRPRTGGGEPPG